MAKVTQEFYCNECDGFIRVRLNMALNVRVVVVCPGPPKKTCGHRHYRTIENGVLYERGNVSDGFVEEIVPPKSAYSKKSLVCAANARHGAVLTPEQSAAPLPSTRSPWLSQLWMERHGSKV